MVKITNFCLIKISTFKQCDRNCIDYDQKLQQLYQLVIQLIAELLPSALDIRVTYILFAALQTTAGESLVEKHPILTVPTIGVLAAIQLDKHVQKSQTQNSGRPELLQLKHYEAIVAGNPTIAVSSQLRLRHVASRLQHSAFFLRLS